jgi:hypothetical protein
MIVRTPGGLSNKRWNKESLNAQPLLVLVPNDLANCSICVHGLPEHYEISVCAHSKIAPGIKRLLLWIKLAKKVRRYGGEDYNPRRTKPLHQVKIWTSSLLERKQLAAEEGVSLICKAQCLIQLLQEMEEENVLIEQ